jgi:PHD/YefM family antitoxin component YafN of YafNO toxin-antitoxin module
MGNASLEISEARKQLPRLNKRLKEERLIWVTKHNKRVFAIVDKEFLDAVLETLEILQDPAGCKMLQQSLADVQSGRVHSHEEIEREMML